MTANLIRATPKNMRRVPAGRFVMGSNHFYPEERPAHEEYVDSLWMDEHPVTNAEFRRFVSATGYVTVAEQTPKVADFPEADPDELVPGSLVFQQATGPIPLDDWRRWWVWTPGAMWRRPDGPNSTLYGRERHPVVHISYEDALTYADWVGKELATEAEWEYAARAGGEPTVYAWGDDFMPRGRPQANTWLGRFPWENLGTAGRERTTPIGSYAPNGWGLIDLIGNVWEWTCSPWTETHGTFVNDAFDDVGPAHSCCAPGDGLHSGAAKRESTLHEQDRRVMKGGSHLCSPTYCLRYRPPARQGQHVRSSTSHLGFRCVLRT